MSDPCQTCHGTRKVLEEAENGGHLVPCDECGGTGEQPSNQQPEESDQEHL